MSHFHQADTCQDRERIQGLFSEYLQWVNAKVSEELGIGFDVQAKVAGDMAELQKFSPPDGRLILVNVESELAGLGCLRTIGEGVGEIKRMYVRPQFRGRGLGRGLLDCLIDESTTMGHRVVRLDSAWFMDVAHSLYRSSGFRDTDPYPESEIPQEIHHLWIFMEKDLQTQA